MHRVRLVFARDRASVSDDSRFHVALQGKTVLENFAPATMKSPVEVHEFQVPIAGELTIALTPADKNSTTVLSGVEIVRE